MTSAHRQLIYGLAALAGLVATWYWNIQFMSEQGGFPVLTFVSDAYLNAASASISNDILVVTLAFLFWSFHEARRTGMQHWWLYPVLTFAVAMAFAFPLFLLMRERRLAADQPGDGT
jgi:Protein of unknown function DUF2834